MELKRTQSLLEKCLEQTGEVAHKLKVRTDIRRAHSMLDKCLEKTGDLAVGLITPEILIDG